ncbi:unnamed protein product [Rhodiola kirilowii]
MRGRVVVFPIKGRNWCFSRSVDHAVASSGASALQTPTTLKELWKKINANAEKPVNVNVELVVDFASDKVNKAWTGLEQAPQGTLKNKLYGFWHGLSRLRFFFKSITKEVSEVEIVYPTSLNAQLVRRRLRHIASRGCVIHKKYLYASASLVPLTTAFTVMQPSEFHDNLYHQIDPQQCLRLSANRQFPTFATAYDLHKVDVLKYRDSM